MSANLWSHVKEPTLVFAAAFAAVGTSLFLIGRKSMPIARAQSGKPPPNEDDAVANQRLKRRPSWAVKFEGPEPTIRPEGLSYGADLIKDMSVQGRREIPP